MKDHYPKVYLYKRIVQAKLFIDSHFAEHLDLDNISNEAYFSKYHFIRLFKKIYGKTPYQYLISVRLDNAKNLLKGGMSVTEVCTEVGFESLSSFSGLFKRTFRISPSDYLIQYQLVKKEMAETPLKFVPSCFASQHGWSKNSNFGEVDN